MSSQHTRIAQMVSFNHAIFVLLVVFVQLLPVINIRGPCRKISCKNGGICLSSKKHKAVCQCPSPFYGSRCQRQRSPCLAFKCQNGGSCQVDQTEQKPYCQCLPGYYGDDCQFIVTDPCKDYCNNGGSCQVYKEQPLCTCTSRYYGERCQMQINDVEIIHTTGQCPTYAQVFSSIDICSGQRCDNDWDCSTQQRCCSTICGNICLNNDIKDYLYNSNLCDGYCLNGGECTNVPGSLFCTCRDGFFGERCEQTTGVCPDPSIFSTCMCECEVDVDCPGDQKCCKTSCGGQTCSASAPVIDLTVGDPCEGVVCKAGSVCRVVYQHLVSEPHVECVPLIILRKDIDRACIQANCLRAILTHCHKDPSKYGLLNCKSPHPNRECPSGSACVADGIGRRICCHGTLVDEVKPGLCPPPAATGISGIKVCFSDRECGPDGKCCEGPTGVLYCRQSIIPVICPISCPYGSICLMKPQACPSGDSCDESLHPACVPENCTGCADDEICTKIGQNCNIASDQDGQITQCLDLFECRQKNKTNLCGRCQDNQVCIDTGIVCVTEPCQTYQCVANNSCGGCRDNQVCVESNTSCDTCKPYTCHPRDPCGGCAPAEVCVDLYSPCNISVDCGLQLEANPNSLCVLFSCETMPNRQCVINTTIYDVVPVDACERCPPGLVCVDTLIRCAKSPCPTYKCVKPEPAMCRLQCDRNSKCLFVTPECTTEISPQLCDKTPTQQCVPGEIKVSYCQRPPIFYDSESSVCILEIRKHPSCVDNGDCPENKQCCLSKCRRTICIPNSFIWN